MATPVLPPFPHTSSDDDAEAERNIYGLVVCACWWCRWCCNADNDIGDCVEPVVVNNVVVGFVALDIGHAIAVVYCWANWLAFNMAVVDAR